MALRSCCNVARLCSSSSSSSSRSRRTAPAPPCRSSSGSGPSPRDPRPSPIAPTATLEVVKQTVAANKVVIFSKTVCPYSKKAKQTLHHFLQPEQVKVVEVDQEEHGSDITAALAEVTGGRTVPRVFVGGSFIGGGDDVARKAESGELEAVLLEAGVLDKPSPPNAP